MADLGGFLIFKVSSPVAKRVCACVYCTLSGEVLLYGLIVGVNGCLVVGGTSGEPHSLTLPLKVWGTSCGFI